MKNARQADHSFRHRDHETPVFSAVLKGILGGEPGQIRAGTEKTNQGLNCIGIPRIDLA
jgi:hypothetical protein